MIRLIAVSTLFCAFLALPLSAQLGTVPTAAGIDPLAPSAQAANPLTQPTLSPGMLLLLDLDMRLSKDVETHGGKAFGEWFAPDGVALNNGKAAVVGKSAISAQADWDPKTYQLTWATEGAQMGPSNDMGFTWGRYTGHSKDKTGAAIDISGRYMTVWKKMSNGQWKISMEASANDAPPVGACCTLPNP